MSEFTELETAVLHAIFAETPKLQGALERQFQKAKVVERENSGCGFFTTIATQDDVEPVSSPSPLGRGVAARIVGLNHGMGFILFMEDGRIRTLEGFTYADTIVALDLTRLNFEVLKVPQGSSM